MPSTETTSHTRGSIALAPHVQDAIERAHEITQDCLRYLHDDIPTTKAARRAKAAVAQDQVAALQALPSLVGQTLVRTTSSGRILSITITRRHLAAMKACVDAVYGLAKKWSAVNERVEPIVPLTRALAAQMASQLFETSMRTWTKWLPWLHVAGALVYQHGTHNHPTLVGIPSLYRAHVRQCRDVVKGRFADGFTTYLDDAEIARRGRWWEPICATMLDEIGDVHERAAAFADHLLNWCERARGAAAKKQAAILEALMKRAGDGAQLAAARALERAALVKERLKAGYEQRPPTSEYELAARRSALNDAERSVMAAQARVKAAANEAIHSGVQAIVALGQKALGQPVTPVIVSPSRGGGTKLHRNDLQDYFVVLEGKNARATPAKPIQAPAAQPGAEPNSKNNEKGPATPEAGQGQVRAGNDRGDDSPTSMAAVARAHVEASADGARAFFAIFAPKRSADAR